MYKFAISRPITTLMFALTLIFFGTMSLQRLPVALFPDIDFPIISIVTSYPGANARTVESKVTDKIEEAVMGIDGIKKVQSKTANNTSVVTVEFHLEKPVEEAMNDVRDKVSAVELDTGVKNPVISKFDTSGSPIIDIFLSTDKVSEPTMMKYADNVIKPVLQRIPGVGGVELSGYRKRQVKIYPNPTLMNKYGITFTQLRQKIADSNVEIDGGEIIAKTRQWVITTDANAQKIAGLGEIRVASGVKLSDVATIEDGLDVDNSYAVYNKTEGVILQVLKISGKNDIDIADGVYAALPELKAMSPDYHISAFHDTTGYIRDSIADVKFDLVLGAFLAVAIVFLFLRNVRITLVSALSIPISIMGTFAMIDFMGQTLNMLTLLGMTLSIGLIIDDAIVVIENIQKKLEQGIPKRKAAFEGVSEISFAIVAISAMLLSVFVPIGNMTGIVGRFFQGFGITVACAIVISYIIVVTFIPMVSSILIDTKQSNFYIRTIPIFKKLDTIYVSILHFVMGHRWQVIIGVVCVTVFSFFLLTRVGSEFMGQEDRSEFIVYMKTAPGISMQEMQKDMQQMQRAIVAVAPKAIKYSTMEIGFTNERKINFGRIYVRLVPIHERSETQFAITAKAVAATKALSASKGFQVAGSPVSLLGGGDSTPFQVVLFGEQSKIEVAAKKLAKILLSDKRINSFHTRTTDYQPEYKLRLIRSSADKYNLTPKDIGDIVNNAFSGVSEISYYRENGKEYDITLRVPDTMRTSINDLKKIQVMNKDGSLIFLDGLVEIEEVISPASITRFNRERSVTIYAAPVRHSGLSLGGMAKMVEDTKGQWQVHGVSYKLQGDAERSAETGHAFAVAITTAFVLIYLILAALYESLLQPLIIMITLPLSFSGAFIACYIFSIPMSMFSMMGLMLLMGIVGKNATLLIDMANEKRAQGHPMKEAIILAGEDRLRPILMTTIAMVFGMLPLAIAKGSGSVMKQPLGISVIGGLLLGMILSLVIVPVFYSYLAPVDDKLRKYYQPAKSDMLDSER